MRINLPYPGAFKLRPYQLEVFEKYHSGIKRFCCEWHRRSGKDKTFFNLMLVAALERKGIYYYMLPETKQAKAVIWEGIDKSGIKFLDHIHPKLLKEPPNNSDLKLTLANGSIIKLTGADRFDSRMGTGAVGMVFSEFSLIDPQAWNYFSPILKENDGWAAFLFTPRGSMNHAALLFDANKDNHDWYCKTITIKDSMSIKEEDLEDERKSGMPEEMIRQEYYCDRSASQAFSYFTKQMSKAQNDNRILDFAIDPRIPVYSFWDIGYRDATTIWLIQFDEDRRNYNAIAYYENNFEKLEHYINWLYTFRDKHGIVYKGHFAPHDASNGSISENFIEAGKRLGINFSPTKRIDSKINAINQARSVIDLTRFNLTVCARGIECLKNYHSRYISSYGIYTDKPVHNWASHGADAFMCFAQNCDKIKNEQQIIRIQY